MPVAVELLEGVPVALDEPVPVWLLVPVELLEGVPVALDEPVPDCDAVRDELPVPVPVAVLLLEADSLFDIVRELVEAAELLGVTRTAHHVQIGSPSAPV